MNIKIGILNVPKHGNKHDLIHFVTMTAPIKSYAGYERDRFFFVFLLLFFFFVFFFVVCLVSFWRF